MGIKLNLAVDLYTLCDSSTSFILVSTSTNSTTVPGEPLTAINWTHVGIGLAAALVFGVILVLLLIVTIAVVKKSQGMNDYVKL